MSAFVFTGPTLMAEEARAVFDAVYLPPAQQGDVYRAALRRPKAIGIIDGYFEGHVSVWHKEILWAMARGVHVFGSASMGALRAAELADYGMKGVGWVFEEFQCGTLEDDDEVAVVHGPEESGYIQSEPMVNIRCTLERAEGSAIISSQTRERLVAIGKALFYKDRSWPTLLGRARGEGLPSRELDALWGWLPDGRVNQKRADALRMLREMRDLLSSEVRPMQVDYCFQHTEMWERITEHLPALVGHGPRELEEQLLDELRLEPDLHAEVRQAALLRRLAVREAARRRLTVSADLLRAVYYDFRRARGLWSKSDEEAWCRRNDLDPTALEDLLREEACVERVRSEVEPLSPLELLGCLRLRGDYARLADRAEDKARNLAARGGSDPEALRRGPMLLEALAWYFERRIGRGIPDDIEGYALAAGYSDGEAFHRAVLREFLYARGAGRQIAPDELNSYEDQR